MEDINDSRWWEEYNDVASDNFLKIIAYEDRATHFYQAETLFMPGLLQTLAYARAILRSCDPEAEPATIERRAQLRMARQKAIFQRTPEAQLDIVIDEGILHRQVGGAEVMKVQIQHLRQLIKLANVKVSVVLLDHGGYTAMTGPLTIMTCEDPHPEPRSMVYYETALACVNRTDIPAIHQALATFTDARAAAVPLQSDALLNRILAR